MTLTGTKEVLPISMGDMNFFISFHLNNCRFSGSEYKKFKLPVYIKQFKDTSFAFYLLLNMHKITKQKNTPTCSQTITAATINTDNLI